LRQKDTCKSEETNCPLALILLLPHLMHTDEECDSQAQEDWECDVSFCIIDGSEDQNPLWIGCDCGLRFHLYCL